MPQKRRRSTCPRFLLVNFQTNININLKQNYYEKTNEYFEHVVAHDDGISNDGCLWQ